MSGPVCKKCGKKLTDALSIAMGVGPVCRGGGAGRGRSMRHRPSRRGGRAYAAFGSGGQRSSSAVVSGDTQSLGMEWESFPVGTVLILGEVEEGVALTSTRLSDGRWKNSANGNRWKHSRMRHFFSDCLDALLAIDEEDVLNISES